MAQHLCLFTQLKLDMHVLWNAKGLAQNQPVRRLGQSEGRNVLKKCLVPSLFCPLMSCFVQVLKKPWSMYLTPQLKMEAKKWVIAIWLQKAVFQHSTQHLCRWETFEFTFLGNWGNLWPLELWWKPWLLCLAGRGAGTSAGISFCGEVGWLQHLVCPLDWFFVEAPSPVVPKLVVYSTVSYASFRNTVLAQVSISHPDCRRPRLLGCPKSKM